MSSYMQSAALAHDAILLHAPTLLFAIAVFSFILAAVATGLWSSYRSNRYGHRDMAIALFFCGLAFLLYFLADRVPFVLSFLVANIAVMQVVPYSAKAYCRVAGEPYAYRGFDTFSLIGITGVLGTYFFDTSRGFAVFAISLGLALQLGLFAERVIQRLRTHESAPYLLVCGVLLLYIGVFVLRAKTAIFGDFTTVLPGGASPYQIATLIFATLYVLVTFTAFLTQVTFRCQQELSAKLSVDPITGFLTAGAFRELEPSISERARKESYALVLLEVDQHLHLNERFGRAAGDRALAHVARAIAEVCPPQSVLVRYDRNDFCVLIWGCSEQEANQLTHAMVAASSAQPALLTQGPTSVTVSLGYAIHEVSGAPRYIEEVAGQAAHALQTAQRWGRNQACSAGVLEAFQSRDGYEPIAH